MVPVKGEWTPFKDVNDQIEHYRLWGLIPSNWGKEMNAIRILEKAVVLTNAIT